MRLVEQHVIRDTDRRYAPIDRAAFASKNLYRKARKAAVPSGHADARAPSAAVAEESYTSKASFLDADPLPVHGATDFVAFSGKPVKRGFYRAADGRHINADVNGAYNIIRKVLPDAFGFGAGKGIADAAVHPVRLPVRTKRVA